VAQQEEPVRRLAFVEQKISRREASIADAGNEKPDLFRGEPFEKTMFAQQSL
jgi:hypothetical protein